MGLILLVGAFIVSFVIMRRVVAANLEQEANNETLTKSEKIWVWVLCFLSPIAAGTVFYYGWRKPLPQKAKEANTISWLAFALRIGVEFVVLIPRMAHR